LERSDILKKKQRIAFYTKLKTLSALTGEWDSTLEGEGSDLSEIREYQSGDDIRKVDWKSTAKMGQLYMKTYLAERGLTVMLLMDQSQSMFFGSLHKKKQEAQATIAGFLALSALLKNNRVGFIGFTNRVERYIPPQRGRTHLWKIIDAILAKPNGQGTSLKCALDRLDSKNKRSLVFIISDFFISSAEFDLLRYIKNEQDLIPVVIEDQRELELPKGKGLVQLQDMETGQILLWDAIEDSEIFSTFMQNWKRSRQEAFSNLGLDYLVFNTEEEAYIDKINHLFHRRRTRRVN
jgi:uncharacterized protein (DUF58 family)